MTEVGVFLGVREIAVIVLVGAVLLGGPLLAAWVTYRRSKKT